MDSTPGVAPFQVLLQPLRDKEALVIPSSGASALERTPAALPFPFEDNFEAEATLAADGELKGKVKVQLRSDSELIVRAMAQNLAPAQWDQGTQLLANLWGFSGTTSNSSFEGADDTKSPLHLSYDYTRKPFGDWDNFRIVPLFPVIGLPASSEKKPSQEIDLGAVRTEIAQSRIKLPQGFGADLPDAVHVKTDFATFDKTYRFENGDLIAERKIAVLQSKLSADRWEQYKKFTTDISLGDETWVQLTSSAAGAKGSHPPAPGENNPEAAKLVSEATDLERNRDWTSALAKLDSAKKLQPEQPYLWSNYGYLAMVQNRPEEAEEDYKHELEHHPDEGFVVNLYGRFLVGRGESDEALRVAKTYFERDAADPTVAALLASLQARASLVDAIATLRRAHDANPDDRSIQNALADYLLRNHQDAEATEIAGKLLNTAGSDPLALNDAAYLLAEANGDLAVAEQKSRESLELLDSQTSQSAIGEANRQSFSRSSLLAASWDTLGYILMKEKKLEDARDYLEAAWNDNLGSSEVGLHYGQLLEAEGKKQDALRIYELAWRRPRTSVPDPTEASIRAGIGRMTAAGMNSTMGLKVQSALQEQRTFKLTLATPRKSYWSGTYRLQFAAGGLQDVMYVGASTNETGIENLIRTIELPRLVPSHSNARILRDAVVSCSAGRADCMLVLMPMGSIDAERVQ